MGTMFNDWLTRRMMSAPAGSGPSNIIYELYNYTCDGTAATAINTGIYLFDATTYPNGWDLVLDITVGTGNVGNASYVRCRTQTSPYKGFTMRRNADNANKFAAQVNSKNAGVSASPGTRLTATVEWPNASNKCELLINGGNSISDTMSGAGTTPLVIGGELSSDTTQTWNPDRFSHCTIHSLVITKKTS